MPYGYTPPGRIVELNNLARLRRLNGAFHSSVGATMRYDLLTNERVLFNASPTTSDVQRGYVNYLFKDGALTPEQWGWTPLTLVDPPGDADLTFDLGDGTTCVHFGYAANTATYQGFQLNCTALFNYYPSMDANTWHMNFVFKLDASLGGGQAIMFNPSGVGGVGLCLYGNHVQIRSNAFLTETWQTVVAPVADGWAGAFHRILIINNAGFLSLYVDSTLQNMKDASGAYQNTVIELGRVTPPLSPPVAHWQIGSASADNTASWHLTNTSLYATAKFKYIAMGDNLTDPVLLNATIQLDEPEQADSFTSTTVRPAFLVKSTQEDDTATGYDYPVKVGLQYGTAGSIELNYANTRIAYLGYDGIQAGRYVEGIIAANTTIDSSQLNVEYAVRTNLAAAVTITLPTFTNPVPGSALYFYDLDGAAASKNVSIDPDYANTGYTLNGNTAAQVVISQNWAAVELVYDAYGESAGTGTKNWRLVPHNPATFDYVAMSANTTLGIPSGVGTVAICTGGTSGIRYLYLPMANTVAGKLFFVKKADTTANNSYLYVYKNPAGSDNFDMPAVLSHQLFGKHDAAMYMSDGTVYWKTFRMCQVGTESIRRITSPGTVAHDMTYQQNILTASATVTLPPAADLSGKQHWFHIANNGVVLTLDPNGSETFGGVANTLVLKGRAKSVGITSSGTGTDVNILGYQHDNVTTHSTNSTIAWPTRVALGDCSAGNRVLTLPNVSTYAHMALSIKKIDATANTLTIDGYLTNSIDGALNTILYDQYEAIDLYSDGTNWYVIGVGERVPKFWVSQALQVDGTLNVESATVLNSTLNTVGAVIFSNTLNTAGAVQFNSTLNTTGAVQFNSTLNVEGAATLNSTLALANTLTITVNSATTDPLFKIINLGTGDASMYFKAGAAEWTVGCDNDDSDSFKVSYGNTHGSAVVESKVFTTGSYTYTSVVPNYSVDAFDVNTTVTFNLRLAGSNDDRGYFQKVRNNSPTQPGYFNFGSVVGSVLVGLWTIDNAGTTTIQSNSTDVVSFANAGISFSKPIISAVNVNTANGIDYNPGSDTNTDLITVGVTGAPKLWWNEATTPYGNYFAYSAGFAIANTAPGWMLFDTNATADYGAWRVICDNANYVFRTMYDNASNGENIYVVNRAGVVVNTITFANGTFILSGDGVSISATSFGVSSPSTFTGAINVSTTGGIDYNPGSDTDTDIITVGVTGSPRIWWDENPGRFIFTEPIYITPSDSPINTSGQSCYMYMGGCAIPAATAATNYHYGFYVQYGTNTFNIPVDSSVNGYIYGMALAAYAASADFKGVAVKAAGCVALTGISGTCNATAQITNCIGVSSSVYRNTGTINTGYLFYGDYLGSGAAGVFYGIYCTGENTNYLSGDLRVDKDLYFSSDGSGLPYGHCWGNEIAWTQASAAANTWYAISDTDMTDGELNEITHDGSGKLTVTKAGRYLVNYSVTALISLVGKHIQSGVMVNGTITSGGIQHYDVNAASAELPMSGTTIVDLAASAYVEVAVRTTDTGTPDIEVDHLNITLLMIGGT